MCSSTDASSDGVNAPPSRPATCVSRRHPTGTRLPHERWPKGNRRTDPRRRRARGSYRLTMRRGRGYRARRPSGPGSHDRQKLENVRATSRGVAHRGSLLCDRKFGLFRSRAASRLHRERHRASLLEFCRIRFFGRAVPRSEVRDIMGAIDFAILPSRFEPFGLVQLEAMAMGALPVASATGATRT